MESTTARTQRRSVLLSNFVFILAVLAVPSLAVPLTNSIEFGDIKCKLPGWPGHPAPTCDPNVPNQCCAGTKCAPDPYDPTHNTCQQADISVSEHALTASVLTSHVETLLTDALTQLKVASTSLYLSGNRVTTLSDKDIVMRAQNLVSNHGNVDTGASGANDWHKYAHGGENPQNNQKEKNALQGAGDSGAGQGGFDYSKYYGGGAGQSGSGSKGSSSDSQGGFDYQKYMPKNVPSSSDNDDKKKSEWKSGKGSDEKEHSDTPPANEGQGGFDYSQYYPYSGDPHKKGYHGSDSTKKKNPNVPTTDTRPSKQRDGQKDGFDSSQYWPKPVSKNIANGETLDEDDADILKKAGLQLLQADAEYKASSAQAKRDVLERVRGILDRLESMVDRELGEVEGEHSWSMDGTKSPTLVWNDPSDFWSKYIPKMPNQGYGQDNNANKNGKDGGSSFNTGDRKPGSLGGPCGRTSYKDFGPCTGELKCIGLDAQRPGLCQVEKSKTMRISREAALQSLKLAEEASISIKAAAIELLVGAAPSNNLSGDEEGDNGEAGSPLSLNKSTLDVGEYSPTTIAVVLLGVAVLGYFCWLNTSGKRRAYQNIDSGWGARA